MKNSYYIHVGYGRTATTFLQNKVFPAHETINYLGKTESDYPEWLIRWHYLDDFEFEKDKGLITAELDNRCLDNKVNLVSSEGFTMYGGNIYAQAKRIAEIVPDARIVLVLRDPVEQICSRYSYLVKSDGFFRPLGELIDWERTPYIFYKRKPIYLPDLYYDETIEIYVRIFGKDSLCVLKYEQMVDDPEMYFSVLGNFLGVDFNIDALKDRLGEKINESPSSGEISETSAANLLSLIERYQGDADRYISENPEAADNQDGMNPDLRRKLEAHFRGKCSGYY